MNADLSPSDSLSSLTSGDYSHHFQVPRQAPHSREYVNGTHRVNRGNLQRLNEDLYEANRTLRSNQHLLKNYQHRSREQSSQLTHLQNELDVSRHKLQSQKRNLRREEEGESTRHLLQEEESHLLRERRLADQLEFERQERIRLQSEKAKALDMLEESRRQKDSPHHVDLHTLLGEMQAMRTDIQRSRNVHKEPSQSSVCAQDTSVKQMKTIQKELSAIHETVTGDQNLIRENSHKVEQLAGQVGQLVVARSSSRDSSSQDGPGVRSERELKREAFTLRQELTESESERLHLSKQCDIYADLCDKQKVLCDGSVLETQKCEASLHSVAAERDRALAHCQRLEDLVAKAENQLTTQQAHCSALQKSSKSFEASESRNQLLREEVEKLNTRLRDQDLLLSECSQNISSLHQDLLNSSHKLSTTKLEAGESVRNLRAQCRKQSDELTRFQNENAQLSSLYEDILRKSRAGKSRIGSGTVDEFEMKGRLAETESNFTQSKMEKAQLEVELSSVQSSLQQRDTIVDKLQSQIASLQSKVEELTSGNFEMREKYQTSLHKLSSEKKALDTSSQHHSHLLTSAKLKLSQVQSERSGLKNNISRLQQISQNLKAQLSTAENKQATAERRAQDLGHMLAEAQQSLHDACAETDKKLQENAMVLQEQHRAELNHVQQDTAVQVEQLQSAITKLEVQLEDKESTLRALRRQQLKAFSDQQRIGDDLNKSLEDTDKLRRKYFSARKYYEEKLSALETEAVESDSLESSKLRRDLREAHRRMTQLADDYKLVLGSVQDEIDSIASRFGHFDQVSTTLPLPLEEVCLDTGQSQHLKMWITIVMAKLKWIQRQIDLDRKASFSKSPPHV